MKDTLRRFIVEEILDDPDFQLAYDEPIIEHSIIDSTEILKIVLFVEERFGISVSNDDIQVDNLGSIKQICDFVERKRAEC